METELYNGVDWQPYLRDYYAETLRFYGFRADSKRSFDRFVARMEERMEEFLADSRLDHSGLGLVREEE
jgi:hypothetical protein